MSNIDYDGESIHQYCLKITHYISNVQPYLSCYIIPVQYYTSIHKLNGYALYNRFPSYDYDVIIIGEGHRKIDLSILQDIPANCKSINIEGDFELNKDNYEYLKYFKHLHPHIQILNTERYIEF